MWQAGSRVCGLSSPSRDHTHTPCPGRGILNSRITREVLTMPFSFIRGQLPGLKEMRCLPLPLFSCVMVENPCTPLSFRLLHQYLEEKFAPLHPHLMFTFAPMTLVNASNTAKSDIRKGDLILPRGSVRAKLPQSCLTLCNPLDCSPPGSSVHGILQTRILGWVAMPSPRGSSPPRD